MLAGFSPACMLALALLWTIHPCCFSFGDGRDECALLYPIMQYARISLAQETSLWLPVCLVYVWSPALEGIASPDYDACGCSEANP
jgi:hypothetical protein